MEAIVISGMSASGKTTLASTLSRHFGIPVLGGSDILKQMAIERGYKPGGETWWDTAEGMRFLAERQKDPEFDKETDRRMRVAVEAGNVIVTSYTAPWIIRAGFKIWLSASQKTRAERMAKRDGTTVEETIAVIRKRDEENRKLYKNLYNIDFGNDLKPFDLVVETDDEEEEAVTAIAIKELTDRGMMK